MAETSFQIGIGVEGTNSLVAAADAADKTMSSFETAASAATAASDAVKLAEKAYSQAESAADRATKALEKNNIALETQRTKLAAASQAGDASAIKRAEDAIAKLNTRQLEAAAAAEKAKLKLVEEATALDKLKVSEDAATSAKEKAKKADEAAKASMGSGKVNEMAEAFGKLGGPVGSIGQKLFGAEAGFKKLKDSMGSTAALAGGAAIGIGVVAAAIAAVSVAAISGTAAVLKWAITLADKNKDVGKQTDRLRSNFDKIFSGLKIGGVIDGLSKVADLFEENSASAKAIKAVFESIFQPLVDGIAAFIPKVIAGFIQFEIWVMKAMIAIKPFGSTLVKIGEGIAITFGVIGALVGAAIAILLVPFALLFGGIAAVVAVVWLLVVAVQAAAQWLGNLGTAISNGAGQAFDWLKTKATEAINWLSSLSLSDIGTALIQGLIMGITGAGPALISSITGLAGGAITAAKKALGIASPSTVFAEIGVNTAEGMVQGVDDTAPAVQGSLESMVAPPEAAAPVAAATASASGSGGGHSFEITINAAGGDGQSIAAAVQKAILDILEGTNAQSGTAVPA